MLKNITSEDFQTEVLDRPGLVLVDVWAEWCGPCQRMNPVLSALSDQLGEQILVAKVDADANPSLVEELKVQGIPTMILYVDGVPVETIVGARPRMAIESIIFKHLVVPEEFRDTGL
jgi:thioredoxin 1